ncbi:MAG: 4Fe-4S dicluster domain-containing protein [Bacteroidetes bacterium]|nr:4Fe-4S dicluster domain-containing protein [Bacteroidota bacterium]
MRERVNTQLKKELRQFGIDRWNDCFHCGNCTAICPLTEQDYVFPRDGIRTIQIGSKKDLSTSLEPWLCYYCGECSTYCPRSANPGEIMMSLRRYLTSVYDWTGLARKMYTSKIWEFGAIIFFALVILALFLVFSKIPEASERLTADGGVAINKFAPVKWIHLGDWIMAGLLVILLASNIFNMFLKVIIRDKTVSVPITLYFKEFWAIIWHFGSQWRFSKCEEKPYWLVHWFLMSGYVILFTMIVFFLNWFQTDNIYDWFHPQRILGYYATAGLFIGIIYFIFSRIRKIKEHHKYSHVTDWTFLVLLFLTTLSGILLHVFRINGLPYAAYYMYVAHLMVLVPMLVLEVPFSKWSHLAYRPFAIYFARVKQQARKQNKR